MSNLAFESGGNLAAPKGETAAQAPSVAMGVPDDQARMQKYGGLAKKSTPHMLLNRRKPQKNYFDSGDYNMARQLGAGRGQGMKSRPALSSMVTGTMAPTPEAVEMTRHPHHEQSKLVEDSLTSSGSSSAGTPVSPGGSFSATNGHSTTSSDVTCIAGSGASAMGVTSDNANSSDVAMEDACSTNSNTQIQGHHHSSMDNWNTGESGPGQLSANAAAAANN